MATVCTNVMNKSTGHPFLWTLLGVGAAVAARAYVKHQRTMRFTGKTVVITGGSRGLGLVMARQFAKEGANVAICARDADELIRAEADLLQYGTDILAITCDLTRKPDIDAFITTVEQQLGPIDVLVNNAGVISVSPYENTTEEDFKLAMDSNFWAAYRTVEAVLPGMRDRARTQPCRIVNITSIGGKVAIPHMAPYSASKFALVGYSEGIRAELLKDGILVTTVCPGLIRTGSPRHAIIKGQNEKEYAWFKIADALPLLTVSAEECARQVLDACRIGRAQIVVSLPAKMLTALHSLKPGLFMDTLSVVKRLLPAPGGIGEASAKGHESESAISQSFVATLADQAAEANNE